MRCVLSQKIQIKSAIKSQRSQSVGELATGCGVLCFFGGIWLLRFGSLVGSRILPLVLGELQEDLLQRRLAHRVVLHVQLVPIALHQAEDPGPFHPRQGYIER